MAIEEYTRIIQIKNPYVVLFKSHELVMVMILHTIIVAIELVLRSHRISADFFRGSYFSVKLDDD